MTDGRATTQSRVALAVAAGALILAAVPFAVGGPAPRGQPSEPAACACDGQEALQVELDTLRSRLAALEARPTTVAAAAAANPLGAAGGAAVEPGPPPKVELDALDPPRRGLAAAIQSRSAALSACLHAGGVTQHAPTQELQMAMRVEPDGQVSGVQVGDRGTLSDAARRCVADAVVGLRVPEAKPQPGYDNTTYAVPFVIPAE